MRITNNMMIANMTRNLQNNIRKLNRTQLEYNTGKRIHRPSDDPVGITRSLKVRADISELNQYKKNVEDATSWLENTEQAVVSNHEALKRLRDLMVQGANGPLTTEETTKIQAEVAEIKKQIISIGNTTYSGNYIFSGKNTDQKLFNDDGSYAVNIAQFLDTSIIDHRMNYEVGVNEHIPVNTVGTSLFEAANLTMSVELPTVDGDAGAKKIDFLGAEINITKNGNDFELTIKIGEDIIPISKTITGITDVDAGGNPFIVDTDTKEEIYKEINNIFNDIKTDPVEGLANIEKWNKLLVEKDIPADINNLTFGTYENGGQAVGIVAQPEKAGLVNLIERIEKNLVEGNYEEVSNLLGPIDKFLDKALIVRGEIGAKVNRTELILNRIEDDTINLRELQSKLEDADMAETAIRLMNEENVYRSSLSVGARIIQPTLLDFLR